MNKKIFFIFAFLFIFSITLVSAQPPFQQSTGTEQGLTLRFPPVSAIKIGRDVTSHMHVYNSTNDLILTNTTVTCFADLYNSTGNHLLRGQMSWDGISDFELLILGGNFTINERQSFIIWCNSSTAGGFVSGGFDVTSNGMEFDNNHLLTTIFLILVFIGFGFLIYKDKERIDDEKYFNRLVSKWKDKNYLKFSATALWYNMRKNSYLLQYLIGLVIMMMVYDLTLFYNLNSVSSVFSVLVSLYTWGSAIVTLVFLGNVQEGLIGWREDIENINWGMVNK